MLVRAVAGAALALLLGGALVARGWSGLLRPQDWAVPYLAFFLALELALRRGAGAARVFGLGAAFALLHEGVYAKTALDGVGLFGVDLPKTAMACFDWGMLAVMASHLAASRFPRGAESERGLQPALAKAALSALGAAMLGVYAVKSYFGHYIGELQIGPAWLLTDVLFAAAAWALAAAALRRAPDEPPPWMHALAAFVTWAPGMRLLFAWAQEFSWPGPLAFMLGAAWTAGTGWGFWQLWRWRGAVDETPLALSPVLLYAAIWRVAGGTALLLAYSPAVFDARAAAAYMLLVELPTRAAFAYAFLGSRLRA